MQFYNIPRVCFWEQILLYSVDLKSGLVWISTGLQIGIGSGIRKPNPLKSGWIGATFLKTIWNPDNSVCISNGWDYSYSQSKRPTMWKLDHLKSDLQKCFWILNSDPHCIISSSNSNCKDLCSWNNVDQLLLSLNCETIQFSNQTHLDVYTVVTWISN